MKPNEIAEHIKKWLDVDGYCYNAFTGNIEQFGNVLNERSLNSAYVNCYTELGEEGARLMMLMLRSNHVASKIEDFTTEDFHLCRKYVADCFKRNVVKVTRYAAKVGDRTVMVFKLNGVPMVPSVMEHLIAKQHMVFDREGNGYNHYNIKSLPVE